VWLAAFSNFQGTNLIMLYSPTYLNKVMNFPVSETGLSSALPPLVQFIVKLISGLTSDKVLLKTQRPDRPLNANHFIFS
jgi:hypothetical protein